MPYSDLADWDLSYEDPGRRDAPPVLGAGRLVHLDPAGRPIGGSLLTYAS